MGVADSPDLGAGEDDLLRNGSSHGSLKGAAVVDQRPDPSEQVLPSEADQARHRLGWHRQQG
jgi:hypothetical protein